MSRFKNSDSRKNSKKASQNTEEEFKPFRPEKFVVIGLLVFCLIASAIFGLQGYQNYQEQKRLEALVEEEVKVEYTQPLKLTKYVLRPKQYQAARKAVENFFAATSLEEVKAYIGSPALDSENLRKYYEPIDQLVELKYSKGYQYEDGYRSASFFAYFDKGKVQEIVAFANGDEEYKIDWNSYALCEDIPFTVYLKERPEQVMAFRCYCYVSTYYSEEFPESVYQSLKLTDYLGVNSVQAFVKREDFAASVLSQALLSSKNRLHGRVSIRVAVTVKKLNDALQSVEILGVPNVNWATSHNGKVFR